MKDCFNDENCQGCDPQEICGCEKTYKLLCGIYNGDFLETINVKKGDNLQDIVIKINDKLLEVINKELVCDFTLDNTGTGVELYNSLSANNGLIKSLIDSEYIKISDEGSTVDFKIDTEAIKNYFNTFLNENKGLICSLLNECDTNEGFVVHAYAAGQNSEVNLTTLGGTIFKSSSNHVVDPDGNYIITFNNVPNGTYMLENILDSGLVTVTEEFTVNNQNIFVYPSGAIA